FYADSVRIKESAPGTGWVRLWKMHGSVTWKRVEHDGRVRVVRGEPGTVGDMIYPSFEKYDESRQLPYSAFTNRLTRFLEQDDALLIIAGFSFGDEHINDLIFGALENRPHTHVYALQFNELPEDNHVIQRAYQCSNLIVCGPETGVIGRQRSHWESIGSLAFMDIAFELITEGPKGGSGNADGDDVKKGRMKIGDFNSFCDFLESMTAE
ncbi:MAG: SIR2 family protein, partial [Gammaproteobacteria bacterium]|nr:SIR2 family protein [Gammaproteobacteria bacterium]